jgi:hypothetical protein
MNNWPPAVAITQQQQVRFYRCGFRLWFFCMMTVKGNGRAPDQFVQGGVLGRQKWNEAAH